MTNEQLGPQGFEYERFRELMTQEVNAAIAAAFEAGATEIVVSDSHGQWAEPADRETAEECTARTLVAAPFNDDAGDSQLLGDLSKLICLGNFEAASLPL